MRLTPALRRALERVSRQISFTRRLPKRFHSLRLRVSPGASLKYWLGLNQPAFNDLYGFAERYLQQGITVWDIGANVGVFAFSAAAVIGETGCVLCFEPDSWSVRLLKQSCAFNQGKCAPVDVLAVAVSDCLSLQVLNIPEHSRAASHLEKSGGAGKDLIGKIRERHLVPTVTLDWIATQYPVPDVLKIDVDGGELRVLKGARGIIDQRRPIILTEVYERNADAVGDFFREINYTMFDFDEDQAAQTPIARPVYNTLALPNSAD